MSSASQASGHLLDARKKLVLLCQTGSLMCGFPVAHVSETMRPLPLQPLDGMPAFVAGLSIIRGHLVPVVNLARLLGQDSQACCTRFVVLRAQGRHVALTVEQVIGVRALDAAAASSMPPLLGQACADFVTAAGALDAHLLLILESTRLLPASAWATLGRGGGT